MTFQEKENFYLNEIRKKYPNKSKLNKTEMLNCLGKSNGWFIARLEQNRLDELPKFSKPKKCIRQGNPYYLYEFELFNILEFISR